MSIPGNIPEGWTREEFEKLPREERMGISFGIGNHKYLPGEPRVPSTQKAIHDLFAGKSYAEIRGLLKDFVGLDVPEGPRNGNMRRLRRSAGIPITVATSFDRVVSMVEEWAHKLLTAGQMIDDLEQHVREAVERHGFEWSDDGFDFDKAPNAYNNPLGDELRGILDDNEHIGINSMQRALIASKPTSDMARDEFRRLRGKISNAGKAGPEGVNEAVKLLGQYESYFEVRYLRSLPKEVLNQLGRSLGIQGEITATAVHRQAKARFAERRSALPELGTKQPQEPVKLIIMPAVPIPLEETEDERRILEAVPDIAYMAGVKEFYSGDSRER